jgi:MoaA/NifB/PqqE/SkfB family radical SAM enzyme
MYKLSDIKSLHLETTSKCQAKCPQCARNWHGGKLRPHIELDEITLEQFKEWFSSDFIKQLTNISMCGRLGDPIIAKDTLEIFKYLRETNNNLILNMSTNGSARNSQWWTNLAKLGVNVYFALDGLSDTHSIYRIGTNWEKVIENAKTFIKSGGQAHWEMLVFKHNEHQVDDCEKLSRQLGFVRFESKHTNRFDSTGMLKVLNDEGTPINIIYPTKKSEGMIGKIIKQKEQQEQLPTINCMVKKTNQIYISATGTVNPCCWTNIEHDCHTDLSRVDYMDLIGVWPNLKKQKLSEIFDSGYFDKIEETWTTSPLKVCKKNCGKFNVYYEQYRNDYLMLDTIT